MGKNRIPEGSGKSIISLDPCLQSLVDCGKMTLDDAVNAQTKMNKKERKKLLSKHDYNIWQQKSGYWCTWIHDNTKPEKRRMIRKKEKRDLEDIIIESIKESEAEFTVRDIFEEYVNRKLENGGIVISTHNRYTQCFERHFGATGWDKRQVKDITMEEWSDWLEDQAGKCKLSSKGFSNLKTITGGIIRRARKKKLLDYNFHSILEDIDVRPVTIIKDPGSQVFSQKELQTLLKYLIEHPDLHNLCLLFMLLSGTRVGEMVTLAYEDFVSDTCAIVLHTERRYKKDGVTHHVVAELPKTVAGIRQVYIPEEYSWIIKELRKMRPFAHYVCTNEKGERMTTDCLRKRLYRVCDWTKIDRKSPHKGRKTFCSIILDAGFDKNLVVSLMGHVDISTSENHYHYDRKSNQTKQQKINSILEFKVI